MKLLPLLFLTVISLNIYYVIKLPYLITILFFASLITLAYIAYKREFKFVLYLSFFGLIVVSGIMGGYYADVQGIGGTIAPQAILGGVGAFAIIQELSRSSKLKR